MSARFAYFTQLLSCKLIKVFNIYALVMQGGDLIEILYFVCNNNGFNSLK